MHSNGFHWTLNSWVLNNESSFIFNALKCIRMTYNKHHQRSWKIKAIQFFQMAIGAIYAPISCNKREFMFSDKTKCKIASPCFNIHLPVYTLKNSIKMIRGCFGYTTHCPFSKHVVILCLCALREDIVMIPFCFSSEACFEPVQCFFAERGL